MPGGDRSGPQGQGSRTGRGAGFCGGNDRPGFATAGIRGVGGRGRARRGGGRRRVRGGGQARRWRAEGSPVESSDDTDATPATEPVEPGGRSQREQQELAELRQQTAQLAESLGALQQRLDQRETLES